MIRTALVALLLPAAYAFAQGPPPDGHWPPPPGPPGRRLTTLGTPPGRWWHDPALIAKLGLTPDQQARIDDLYQQSRLRLIDLSAALQKEQTVLEPIVGAEHPDQAKALAQIDRVAQARADLEKANARMLLSFRTVLNQEQWRRLQSEGPHGPPGSHP